MTKQIIINNNNDKIIVLAFTHSLMTNCGALNIPTWMLILASKFVQNVLLTLSMIIHKHL